MIWLGCIIAACLLFIFILFKTAPEYIELEDGSMERVAKKEKELPEREKKEKENIHYSYFSESTTLTYLNSQNTKNKKVTVQ